VHLVGFHYKSNNGVGPKDCYIMVMTASPYWQSDPRTVSMN